VYVLPYSLLASCLLPASAAKLPPAARALLNNFYFYSYAFCKELGLTPAKVSEQQTKPNQNKDNKLEDTKHVCVCLPGGATQVELKGGVKGLPAWKGAALVERGCPLDRPGSCSLLLQNPTVLLSPLSSHVVFPSTL